MDRQRIVQSLRIVYHGFGTEAFFTDSNYIANGLSAAVIDTPEIVSALRNAVDTGVGKLYIPVIANGQVPGHEFVDTAVNYLVYNGMPADAARFAVGVFNDMLGWKIAPVPVPAGNNDLYAEDKVRKPSKKQKSRPERQQEYPQPERVKGSGHDDKSAAPKKKSSFGSVMATILIFLISIAVGFGGSYLFFNYKDIFKGNSKTTPTASYTAVDNLAYKVTAKGTPVFSKEDVNSATVAILDKGDKVTVIAQGSKFSAVTLSNGTSGYIQNEKISPAE